MRGAWLRQTDGPMAVVFIHGILSNGENAWVGAEGDSWPQLLHAESALSHASIYVYTYHTDLFSGNYTISDAVDDLKERFRLDAVHRYKQILFVCHSMGGIVARKFLVSREADFSEPDRTIGFFLVASPSLGSTYANWLGLLGDALGQSQAKVLKFSQSNQWLNDLDREFMNLKESGRLRIVGKELVEQHFNRKARFPFVKAIVQPISGARYFGEQFKVSESDHFSIAKPGHRSAIQHRQLCDFASRMLGIRSADLIGGGNQPALLTRTSLASTNDESQRLIDSGHRLPFILHAWNQVNGKGKLGRTWQGGAGVMTATWNYGFSLDRSEFEALGLLHIATALAVRDAIVELNPALTDVQLKWPNDVLIAGKKVAGILIEIRRDVGGKAASIGIGMNVCRVPQVKDQRDNVLPPASVFNDFADDRARELHVEKAVEAITPHLERRIKMLIDSRGLGAQRTEYEALDYSMGRVVKLLSAKGETTAKGYNRGITAQGQLVLEFAGGTRREYHSGEVTSLRAEDSPDPDEPPQVKSSPVKAIGGKQYFQIKSPMVGTFYRAEGPESPPLVQVGSHVKVGQKICLISAMKIMNVIESDVEGIVEACLVQNGQAIEFEQPLFTVQLTSATAVA